MSGPTEWFDAVCDGRGVPFSVAHAHLTEYNDQDHDELPCCREGACRSVAQWGRIREEDLDVIHATHPFAFVPGLVAGANVVFDERPDFGAGLTTDRLQRAVTAFLREVGAPVETWEQFVALARHEGHGGDAAVERDELQNRLDAAPDRAWYLECADAHTLAPALARATWYALRDDADANGLQSATVPHEPPRLDAGARDDDGWARTWVRVVLDDTNRLRRVWNVPDLGLARSVVGLDAHPSAPLWQLNAGPSMDVRPVLDPTERALWRRFERGLTVVQVGEHTNPLASGEYYTEAKTRAFLGQLREYYGDDFRTCITAASVEERTRDVMREVGVRDPETLHFGEEKSRDDFGTEAVGAVDGSIDPGDDLVEDVLAALDLDATPETVVTETGERRAHGRGFVGPDADDAAAVLASVRENHVAQAAGRYARNAVDPDDRAVVFVRTDAMPPGFADLQVPGVQWVATEKQRDVVEALREREHATTAEVADAAGVSKRHAATTLQRLAEDGAVERREGVGEWGADVYRALSGTADATVDLGAQDREGPRIEDPCTWAFAIVAGDAPDDGGRGATRRISRSRTATNRGGPPSMVKEGIGR